MGGLIQMACQIDKANTFCILDTGTEITIIRSSVLAKLDQLHLVSPVSNMSVQTACGRAVSFGRALITITFSNVDYEVNAIIFPDLKVECLIGLDILEQSPVTRNFIKKLRSLSRAIGTYEERRRIKKQMKKHQSRLSKATSKHNKCPNQLSSITMSEKSPRNTQAYDSSSDISTSHESKTPRTGRSNYTEHEYDTLDQSTTRPYIKNS